LSYCAVLAAEPGSTTITHQQLANAAAYESAKTFEKFIDEHGGDDGFNNGKYFTDESLDRERAKMTELTSKFVDQLVEEKHLQGVDVAQAKKEGLCL
jgi:hypothetical protein